MLLRELIMQEFSFLVNKEHFEFKNIDITYVVKDIVYSKNNITIKISVEEMENYFTIEIEYITLEYNYCISDNLKLCQECNSYSGIKDVVYKNIFDLTKNQIIENDFKDKLNALYKQSKKKFNKKKSLLEIINLYKELIKCTLKNINRLNNAKYY